MLYKCIIIFTNSIYTSLLINFVLVDRAVSIFIKNVDGERIASLVDNGTRVTMVISVGKITNTGNNINKTSVLFVSISFIVLMIISLAWLVFYYIQRFRYAHAKERLSVSIFSNILFLKSLVDGYERNAFSFLQQIV